MSSTSPNPESLQRCEQESSKPMKPRCNESPTKFFRKNKEKMIALSATTSSTFRRPTRLRRSNTAVNEEQKVGGSRTKRRASSSQSVSSVDRSNHEETSETGKPLVALSPIQRTVRLLYERIRRAHKASQAKKLDQVWKENKESNDYLMKQHHRDQSAVAIKSVFQSSTPDKSKNFVTADAILDATMQLASEKATTVKNIKVVVIPEVTDELEALGIQQNGRENQTVPVTTIHHVTPIPPVLDWTAIPLNLHEDDEKFLTNIPFLGDEFIDKDAKFINEMVTLYEGKVHQAEDCSLRKVDDEVFCSLIQAMMKIEAEEGPDAFKDKDNPLCQTEDVVSIKTELDGKNNVHPDHPSSNSESSPRLSPKKTFTEVAANFFSILPSAPAAVTTPINEHVSKIDEIITSHSSNNDEQNKVLTICKDEPLQIEEKSKETNVDISNKPSAVSTEIVEISESSSSRESIEDNSTTVAAINGKPSEQILNLLAVTFKGLGTPNEIRERYENAEKIRQAPPLRILPNGLEEQTPESYTLPNIDGMFAKHLPKESTMHAYQVLFCRRCFTYDCKRHTAGDQVEAKYYKNRHATSSSSNTGTNGSQNFVCKNSDCWQMKATTVPRNPDDILKEWGPQDRSLFSCCIDSWPSNYCYIAEVLRSKTCAQVKEYADLESVPKTESCTKGSSRTRPKHRKVRTGFFKKFSGNSNNKRNLTRQWINNVKKIESSKEDGGIKCAGGKLPPRYMPCLHEDGKECDSSCTCRINKTSCEKFCTCAKTCRYRFPGCKCQSTCDSKRCICFAAARECDPDLCLGCGAGEMQLEKINCHNVNIQRSLHKHLLMGQSDVSGWGIYIKNDAQKGEFIAEYRGEVISHDESERRGHVYDKIQHTFLFELNDHFVVDATRKGNKARFVNSSKNPNCEVKRMLVNGDHRIGIYAKRYIEAGEELFYDYEDVLEKQQKQKATAEAEEASNKRKRRKQ